MLGWIDKILYLVAFYIFVHTKVQNFGKMGIAFCSFYDKMATEWLSVGRSGIKWNEYGSIWKII